MVLFCGPAWHLGWGSYPSQSAVMLHTAENERVETVNIKLLSAEATVDKGGTMILGF